MEFELSQNTILIIVGLVTFLADRLGFKIPPLVKPAPIPAPAPAPVPAPVPQPNPDAPRATPLIDLLDSLTAGNPIINGMVKAAKNLLSRNPLISEAEVAAPIVAALNQPK